MQKTTINDKLLLLFYLHTQLIQSKLVHSKGVDPVSDQEQWFESHIADELLIKA